MAPRPKPDNTGLLDQQAMFNQLIMYIMQQPILSNVLSPLLYNLPLPRLAPFFTYLNVHIGKQKRTSYPVFIKNSIFNLSQIQLIQDKLVNSLATTLK